MKLKEMATGLIAGARRKDTAIMTFVGIGGLFTTIYFSFKAAPKCEGLLEKLKDPDIPVGQKIADTTKAIGPVIGSAAITTGCIVGLYKKSESLAATVSEMATAASAMGAIADITDKKTREIAGEETAEKIKQEVAKAVTEQQTITNAAPVVAVHDAGKGGFIFCEPNTDVYIRATRAEVDSKLKEINLWIKDLWRHDAPDDDAYVTFSDIVNTISPGCYDGILGKACGFHVASLPTPEISYHLTSTFNYVDPVTNVEEPGYVITIMTRSCPVPPNAITYR